MKYIRLTSEANDGIFEADFNEDIEIEKDSLVAYRSLAMTLDPLEFRVDGSNNTITYQSNINNVGTKETIDLPFGNFNRDNSAVLLQNIQDATNKALQINNKNIGHQFQVLAKDGGKTRIEGRFCPNSIQVLTDFTQGALGGRLNNFNLAGSGNISNTGAATANDSNLLFSHMEFGKGCSVFRTRIRSLADNAGASNTNGFEIGLSDVNPTTWDTTGAFTLPDLQKTFNVRVQKEADQVQHNVRTGPAAQTVNTNTGITPSAGQAAGTRLTNDIIEFQHVQGVLKCLYYKHNAGAYTSTEIFSINMDTVYPTGAGEDANRTKFNKPLYPYIIMHGASSDSVFLDGYTRCFFDPFTATIPTLSNPIEESEGNLTSGTGAPINARPPNPLIAEFTFESNTISEYLGYETRILRSNGTDPRVFDRISENTFKASLNHDNIVVELMNIQINSYDSYSRGRRNFLATVATNKDESNSIINEANTLIFLDIDNAQPRFLRNIKARLLYGDLTSIDTIGLSSLSLIIKNKTE